MTKLRIYTLFILALCLSAWFSGSHEGYQKRENEIESAIVRRWVERYDLEKEGY